jgi:hypothetical protein
MQAKEDIVEDILSYEQKNNLEQRFPRSILLLSLKILLTIFFYLILTPVAVCLRTVGIDILGKNLDPKLETYWQLRNS